MIGTLILVMLIAQANGIVIPIPAWVWMGIFWIMTIIAQNTNK